MSNVSNITTHLLPYKEILSFTVDSYQVTMPLLAEVTSVFHRQRLTIKIILIPIPFKPAI